MIQNSRAAARANGRARRATLADVAAAAGVSETVASRALSGYPTVAPGTRERVVRAAQELGYRASRRARALGLGRGAPPRAAMVTLDVPPDTLGSSFLGPVVAGILGGATHEALELQHLALFSARGPHQPAESGTGAGGVVRGERVADALATLVAEDRADGFLLLTFQPLAPEDVAPLDRAGVPYVLVNRHFGDRPAHSVVFAWEEAAADAVRRLHARGHRHFAHLLPDQENTTVAGHAQGWRAAVRALGLHEADAPVLRYPGSPAAPQDAMVHGQTLAHRLLTEGLPDTGPGVGLGTRTAGTRRIPTALVGFNDWCALGILRAARELGVDVPGQLSVIGFDNTLIGVGTTPQLSSYAPRFTEMGRQAAALLGAALREHLPPQRVVVPIDFIDRESCGDVPAARGTPDLPEDSGGR